MIAQYLDVNDSNKKSRRALEPNNIKIAIQDSTGEPGAADDLVAKLKKAGYRNVFVAEPWKEPLSETRIVAQQGDGEGAEAIRRALEFGDVRVESTGNLKSDITIKVGKDWLQRRNSSN